MVLENLNLFYFTNIEVHVGKSVKQGIKFEL